MKDDCTSFLKVVWDGEDINLYKPEQPILFITSGRVIRDFYLAGRQVFGRYSEESENDIAIANRFVSRTHGIFETDEGQTVYTALETTNGILYHGELLQPGQSVLLQDGDELIIPDAGEDEGDCIVLIYADSRMRIHMWRELQQTSRDRLTGLYNREGFLEWWKVHHNHRDYDPSCLFMLDVDDFKQVNDTKGHNAGDRVLQIVSECLCEAVRYEHQVCRWGGDEFIGIIPGSPENIRNRLRLLERKIIHRSHAEGIDVTVSIGCADIHSVTDRMDINGLVRNADIAMYNVKKNGKGNISFYEGKKGERQNENKTPDSSKVESERCWDTAPIRK
ncbi:MAG: GGDEF domain-containing protein [Solobacterium sp.]|nr:GGDEF domain-containing protein [Solobacterium sp.]